MFLWWEYVRAKPKQFLGICEANTASKCPRRSDLTSDMKFVAQMIDSTANILPATTGHETTKEFYYSVGLSKDIKYKAEAAV